MNEGYLEGRVNNNGPRAININTVKDEDWVNNTLVNPGNWYGLGTLAQMEALQQIQKSLFKILYPL